MSQKREDARDNDLNKVQQLPYFDDFGVKTLTNLDSQFQWDNLQKSQFYKAWY